MLLTLTGDVAAQYFLLRQLDAQIDALHKTVEFLGNMASASMPTTLAMNWDKVQSGELVLMLTYGSGATWGAGLYRRP